eukprot:CAMPEP_0174725106 /NCGR_PEP_ID=MMETSP1094-20130205/44820_1 /TAXON_ID=156173 /ORGANISM="Chrysochromulina brevifilum, Strain UTEX LB 985" /LENGTH=69 /DNA_ID=CAMNT_0015926443 /DNA_START=80 /DNA_END=289 /DNA_ORIENTATION=+
MAMDLCEAIHAGTQLAECSCNLRIGLCLLRLQSAYERSGIVRFARSRNAEVVVKSGLATLGVGEDLPHA